MAITTSAAADAPAIFFLGAGQITAVAFFEIGGLESGRRNLVFLFTGILRSRQVCVH